MPLAGHALQLVHASIGKAQSRTRDEVAHRARSQDFIGMGQGGNACSDRYGDARDLAIVQLAFAGMDTGANLEADGPDGIANGRSRLDGPRRSVEGGEEAVPRRVELGAAVAADLTSDKRVVPRQQIPPGSVARARQSRWSRRYR